MPLSRQSGSALVVVLAALALAAQEPKVESDDPASARIRAMLQEVHAARSAGKHEDARRIVREALAACLALPELADRKDAHDLLVEVAAAAQSAGDPKTAHEAWERVHDQHVRTLPDDHPELQRARDQLAMTKHRLGDLPGARALFERVYEVRNRTLPHDHPDLQRARTNLAATKHALGDVAGARALQEMAYEVYRRTMPDDDDDLQKARNNLALTTRDLGDLAGARALQEKVYEVWSRTLPDDHPDLQRARANLAITKQRLGDLSGARALREKVYEICSRTLPDDHPDLQRARNNLANTKQALDDLDGARTLREKVYEVWSRTLPDDHPDLQRARNSLADTKRGLGDLAGARALREKVHEVSSRALPDDHPDLQRARANLADTKRDLGDLAGARALAEKVYEVRSRTLPDDHPDLQQSRGQLALDHALDGNASRAVALLVERCDAARRRLSGWALAPRELGAMATQEGAVLDLLLTLAGGFGEVPAQPQVAGHGLAVSQALHGVQTRAARRSRRAQAADPVRAAALTNELRAAANEISRIASETFEGAGEAPEARRRARDERLSRAVHQKERIERELGVLAAKAGHGATATAGIGELATALPERSAAAAIVGFTHSKPDPEHPGRTINEARLAALVLDRSGTVALCPLGARAEIEAAVTALRAQVGAGHERGQPPREGEDPLAVQRALRARTLDPILAAAGDIDTLWLAVDESLELAPLDALAGEDGEPLGAKLALRPLVSLFDLLELPGVEAHEGPVLLAIGGLDYDAAASDALTRLANDTRAGRPDTFRVLPSSMTEVNAIASYFAKTHDAAKVRSWTGAQATKSVLAAAAPRATFVHLATHGYFAPERIASAIDRASEQSAITGLSPLVLCGLALSGANLPPDDLGRHAGILTAEEILVLDLSRCHLVTLSACDTSLGVRRAGQGYASLRASLQGAGARFVLTSLWKVGDETTMELMVDFYRRLWVQKKEPHTALWEAKMAMRKKGVVFRDWAGWVLTGK